MTTLHDQLGDVVAEITPDLDRLVRRSRQRGLAQRRQRRALALVGVATAVGVVTVGVVALRPDTPGTPVATDSATTSTASPTANNAQTTSPSADPDPSAQPEEPHVRLTGQSTAGLLLDLLDGVSSANIVKNSVRGQGGVRLLDNDGNQALSAAQNEETYAEATVLTQTGRALLAVNVQRSDVGADAWASGTCPAWAGSCTITNIPNGDTLHSYVDSDKPGVVRQVAELVSPERDLRVVVAASTPAGDPSALDLDQLGIIASSPRWNRQVPEGLAAAAAPFGFTSMDDNDRLHPAAP